MSSRVQTVLGEVSSTSLGRTLTHEHLASNFEHFYKNPIEKPIGQYCKYSFELQELNLSTIGVIRQWPYSSKYNLQLNDKDANDAVMQDVIDYKDVGGGTIVENTTEGVGRNIKFYKQVAEESGVNIVAGTGHYLADLTTEEIYNHMLQELTTGYPEAPDTKAGFMGEIASKWPLSDFERRAIQAAGELQPQVGCGVSFSPHSNKEAPFEIIRLYLEAGGSADKVVMSHLDRAIRRNDNLLDFAALGTYCLFDFFGVEMSYYQLHEDIDLLNDVQKIQKMSLLVEEGRQNRILMSHDIHTKHRLTKFGGHGYAHIINYVLPKMKTKGFSQEVIDKITIYNPARWLAIEKSPSS